MWPSRCLGDGGKVKMKSLARVRGEQKPPLLAEAQPCDHVAVPVHVTVVQIAELPPPLPDQHQQSAPRVVVVLVRFQVLGEILNPLGQECNLHFWRAGIRRVRPEISDEFVFALFRQQTLSSVFLCRYM